MDEPVDIDALKTRVRQHREELGLSLRAAAAQSDVPFNTLARVEKGDLPDLANFRRIVEWLGLAPELFFQPPRIRTENTPEIIAHHLRRDPNLTDEAARPHRRARPRAVHQPRPPAAGGPGTAARRPDLQARSIPAARRTARRHAAQAHRRQRPGADGK